MSTTANGLIPPALFVSPRFSPLTPTMTPRSPFLEKHSRIGCRYKGLQTAGYPAASSRLRPGFLDLSVSTQYPVTSHFPWSAAQEAIPSPFRTQLQEDVATTPLPSTPLTARWPGSTIQRSALMLEGTFQPKYFETQSDFSKFDDAVRNIPTILENLSTPSCHIRLDRSVRTFKISIAENNYHHLNFIDKKSSSIRNRHPTPNTVSLLRLFYCNIYGLRTRNSINASLEPP